MAKQAGKNWVLTSVAILLVILYLTGQVVWLVQNQLQPYEHSCRYIQESIVTLKRFADGRFFEINFYPEGGYLAAVVAFIFWGTSWHVAQLSMLVYVPILAIGVWKLGKHLYGNWGALLAVAALLANPWLTAYLHGFIMDIPLLTAVTWAYVLYTESECGKYPVPTLALGAVCAWGMLIKWSFAFFMLPLFVLLGIEAFRSDRRGSWRVLVTIVLCALSTLVLAKFPQIIAYFMGHNEATKWYDTNLYPVPLLPGIILALLWVSWTVYNVWCWKRREWTRSIGIVLACCAFFFICYWWYYLDANYLVTHSVSDLAQWQADGNFAILVTSLVSFLPMLPLLLLGGCIWRCRIRNFDQSFIAIGVGIVTPIVIYSSMNVPATFRYMLPIAALATTFAVAWLANWRWTRWAALVILVALGGVNVVLPFSAWSRQFDEVDTPTPWHNWCLGAYYAVPPKEVGLTLFDFLDTMQSYLESTGSATVIGVVDAGSPCDVDMLISVANDSGHTLYVERYMEEEAGWDNLPYELAYVCTSEPNELLTKHPCLRDCQELYRDDQGDLGTWILYKTNHDTSEENYERVQYSWDVDN